MLSRKAQGTLEYIVIITGIVVAILLALPLIRQKVQSSLEHAATEMEIGVQKIDFGAPGGGGGGGGNENEEEIGIP